MSYIFLILTGQAIHTRSIYLGPIIPEQPDILSNQVLVVREFAQLEEILIATDEEGGLLLAAVVGRRGSDPLPGWIVVVVVGVVAYDGEEALVGPFDDGPEGGDAGKDEDDPHFGP